MHENDNDSIKTSEVNDITAKFENHPSIIKIKENVTHTTKFSFSIYSLDEMNKRIKNLTTTKPSTHVNIPAKILVEHSDLCSEHIHKLYCDSVQTGIFPDSMNYADMDSFNPNQTLEPEYLFDVKLHQKQI